METIAWAALVIAVGIAPTVAILALAKPVPKRPCDPHAHTPVSLTARCPLCHAPAGKPCVYVGTTEARGVSHMKRIEIAYHGRTREPERL